MDSANLAGGLLTERAKRVGRYTLFTDHPSIVGEGAYELLYDIFCILGKHLSTPLFTLAACVNLMGLFARVRLCRGFRVGLVG